MCLGGGHSASLGAGALISMSKCVCIFVFFSADKSECRAGSAHTSVCLAVLQGPPTPHTGGKPMCQCVLCACTCMCASHVHVGVSASVAADVCTGMCVGAHVRAEVVCG